jgi:3-methylfumaryl-CoA hydratase
MAIERGAGPIAEDGGFELGAPVVRDDVCTLSAVRRVAAMLDLDPDQFREGQPLPRGWHFFLLAGDTRRSSLRADGFPGFGISMPDLVGLPRLLLGGRTVEFSGALTIGAPVRRQSRLVSLKSKQAASGEMAFVTVRHEITEAADAVPAIVEDQTYVLLSAGKTGGSPSRPGVMQTGLHSKVVTPDETLLFQYSALGFNSHKIHIDRAFSREVEALPDLVVNGGLTTLLLTEIIRCDLGLVPTRITTKHTAALYCGRSILLTASKDAAGWRLKAYDDTGALAVQMEADVQ